MYRNIERLYWEDNFRVVTFLWADKHFRLPREGGNHIFYSGEKCLPSPDEYDVGVFLLQQMHK